MNATPALDIYRNRETGDFLVQHYIVDKDWFTVATGDFVQIPKASMETTGLGMVLDSLKRFAVGGNRTAGGLERMSKIDKSRFKRAHQWVSVSLPRADKLNLQAMEYSGNGGIGREEGCVEVILPISNEKFYSLLTEACVRSG